MRAKIREIGQSISVNRWYLRNRFIRNSLIVISGIVGLCLIGGSILDWRGFLEGAMTSAAFSGITIVVGLFFVDRLIEHRQREQWAKVRLLTYRGLSAHLCDMAAMIPVNFPFNDVSAIEVLQGRDRPDAEAIANFERLAKGLRTLTDSEDPNRSLSDIASEFYEMVRWDLGQIQSVLTPRLLGVATDQRLIDALVEFDQADRTLYSAILGHKLAGTQSAFLPVANLIAVAGLLYEAMLPHWLKAEQCS